MALVAYFFFCSSAFAPSTNGLLLVMLQWFVVASGKPARMHLHRGKPARVHLHPGYEGRGHFFWHLDTRESSDIP
jgi:hypothetical protein